MLQQFGILYHQLKGRLASKYQTRQMLRAYQSHRVVSVLEKANQQIRFYKSYHHATLEEYPIIDKSFVQEYFTSLNREKLSYSQALELTGKQKSCIELHQSLGTSGAPGIYLYSIREKMASLGNLFSNMFPHFFLRNKRIAFFHLSQTPYLPSKFTSVKTQWLLLDLNNSFDEQLSALIIFNPEVIVASVQTLYELAKLQLNGKIALRCQKIIATAEVLTPLAEKFISSVFKQNIHQLYQSAEGCLGITCEHGTMHLNEEEFYIEKEWIDHKRERFVPVVTTLRRTLQPLIRYRMEDILFLKNEICGCGRVSLGVEKVIGRCEDVLYFKGSRYGGLKPIYADVINQLFAQNNDIVQYQILQHSTSHIEIRYNARKEDPQEWIANQLDRLWYAEDVNPPLVEFLELEPQKLNQMFRTTKRLAKSTVTLLT